MPRSSLLLAAVAFSASLVATGAPAPPPLPPSAKDFVAAVTQSDQFEIVEGQAAAVQSQNPRVRAFAQQMIRDHTISATALGQAAERSGMTAPPMGLGGDQARLVGALQSLSGPQFDQAYARQQVLAHDQGLVVRQGYAGGGSDPNIRDAARSALPLIQHHLEMAREMQAALGGW